MELTQTDIEKLNSKLGIKKLMESNNVDVTKVLRQVNYELDLANLQLELIHLQERVIANGEKIIIIFEGRDAAGKGGAIRRITSRINPRFFRIVALPKPTEEEKGQWYFQRYVRHLPKPGEIIFFDRSWYNRAIVEPAMNFCTQKEYEEFMRTVNSFENMLTESGTKIVKLYLSITKEEQKTRFKDIENSPLKKWKITPVDLKAQELWDVYTDYKQKMFAETSSESAPWKIIDANKKNCARIDSIQYILEKTK